jgi:hypothetical protein
MAEPTFAGLLLSDNFLWNDDHLLLFCAKMVYPGRYGPRVACAWLTAKQLEAFPQAHAASIYRNMRDVNHPGSAIYP